MDHGFFLIAMDADLLFLIIIMIKAGNSNWIH